MSQAKVEQYKKVKANRKKIVARERMQRRLAAIAGWAVLAVLVVWAGASGYRIYENNRPEQTYTIDTSAVDNYIDTLEE